MSRLQRRIQALRRSRLVQMFLHSDLLGVPITIAFCSLFAVSLVVSYFAGALGGIVFVVLMGGFLGLFLTLEGRNAPETMEGVTSAVDDGWHRVLVIANLGLEDPALCAEVCERGARVRTETMIIAPVVASSPLHRLFDDIDLELGVAQGRVDVAVATLKADGIKASGHVAVGDPLHALLEGLREFHAGEVVLLGGGEAGWEDATAFAGRVRNEVGLHVTEVAPVANEVVPTTQRAEVSLSGSGR
jgi:hypothetical protein